MRKKKHRGATFDGIFHAVQYCCFVDGIVVADCITFSADEARVGFGCWAFVCLTMEEGLGVLELSVIVSASFTCLSWTGSLGRGDSGTAPALTVVLGVFGL